jgi:hypothetical protein
LSHAISVPVDVTGSATAAFQVVADGYNPAVDKLADATLSVIAAPAKLVLKDENTFRVCLGADKGAVQICSAPLAPSSALTRSSRLMGA